SFGNVLDRVGAGLVRRARRVFRYARCTCPAPWRARARRPSSQRSSVCCRRQQGSRIGPAGADLYRDQRQSAADRVEAHTPTRDDAEMSELTHVDAEGRARMVAVGATTATSRTAIASGSISLQLETLDAIERNALAKGDAIVAARIAGVMAAKRTA